VNESDNGHKELKIMEEHITLAPSRRRAAGFTLRGFFGIVFRNKKLVVLSFLGVSLGVVATVLILPPQYQAEMKILVERARVDPLVSSSQKGEMPSQPASLSEEEVNSEVDMLENQDILKEVVIECGLHNKKLTWWRKLIGMPPEETRIAQAVRTLETQLQVDPPNKSNLITVSYTSVDARQAARVLQSLGNRYLLKHIEVHRNPGMSDFFTDEVKQTRERVMTAQSRLREFGRSDYIINADAQKTALLQKIVDFESTLRTTDASIAETQQKINSLKAQMKTTPQRMTTQVRTSAALLDQLKSTLFGLQLKKRELLAKYEPSYRLVQDIDKQIADTEAAIAAAQKAPTAEETTDKDPTYQWLGSELAKSQAELAAYIARANATRQSLSSLRVEAMKLRDQESEQKNLIREVAVAEDSYVALLRKQDEARFADAMDKQRIVNAAIAEPPSVPVLPVSSPLLKVLLGMILAGMISIGLAFASDYCDPSFRTPEELEGFLDVPVLAAIPETNSLPPSAIR
jgi:uncharacterized protein involved in exopolysaccharide biosynthesis